MKKILLTASIVTLGVFSMFSHGPKNVSKQNYYSANILAEKSKPKEQSKKKPIKKTKEDLLIEKIIKSEIKKGMTTVETVKAIHDYLVNHLEYDTDLANSENSLDKMDKSKPYYVLTKKKAICQGYSNTFSAFMEKLGIPCKKVVNDSKSHVWNIIKLDDGWYHVDCTWDDTLGKGIYINYDYFLIDDSIKEMKEHQFSGKYPASNGKKHLMYGYKDVILENETLTILSVQEAYERGDNYAIVVYPEDTAPNLRNLYYSYPEFACSIYRRRVMNQTVCTIYFTNRISV